MRKPRDYDSELKALDLKTKQLKERKLSQLGELVIACGTDALPVELLAGALLAATETEDAMIREGWRARGGAFFRSKRRRTAGRDRHDASGAQASLGGAQSAAREAGA